MYISININFLSFNYILSNEFLKVEKETEAIRDFSDTHENRENFLQFTLPKDISKNEIKRVIFKTFKKPEYYLQPGSYEKIMQSKCYFIPFCTVDDLIRIKIGEGTYITEIPKGIEINKIPKDIGKEEIKVLTKIFERVITKTLLECSSRGKYKVLIPTLEFYTKFKDEYITEKIFTRLRSDEDVKNIYTEIIDDIFDDSKIEECLSKMIATCDTVSLLYGDLELEYGIIWKKTVKNWHILFYNAFKVALKDKESCLEIKKSLKNFDILSDVNDRKEKIDGKKLADVIEKGLIGNKYKYKPKFKSSNSLCKKITFQKELQQMVELCIWHLQIQCSRFYTVLETFQQICKSVQVDNPNIDDNKIKELELLKEKLINFSNLLPSIESRLQEEKFIISLKADLLAKKLNSDKQKLKLYDILTDKSLFLQFIFLIETHSSSYYLNSGYYLFDGVNILIPFGYNNTLIVYDSVSELQKPKTEDSCVLKNKIEKSNKELIRNDTISKFKKS